MFRHIQIKCYVRLNDAYVEECLVAVQQLRYTGPWAKCGTVRLKSNTLRRTDHFEKPPISSRRKIASFRANNGTISV